MKKLPERPQLKMFKTVLTSFIHPDSDATLAGEPIPAALLRRSMFSVQIAV